MRTKLDLWIARIGVPSSFIAASLVVACSATGGGAQFQQTSGVGGSAATPGPGNGSGSGSSPGQGGGGDIMLTGNGGSSGSGDINGGPCNVTDPTVDNDGDGFTIAQGDCNDCSPQINPGALDFPGNGIDEDCNGKADDNPTDCDGSLSLQSMSATDGAKAIGLCKLSSASSKAWGLISARYVTADGQTLTSFDPSGLGHGILTGFGPNVHPQEGSKLLALSSGAARRPGDPGYRSPAGYDKQYTTGAPPGYPKESPSCPGVVSGEPHDSVALEVQVRVPTNAKSLAFNLDFYTYEYPIYICQEFNDFFVAILTPAPDGNPDGNISFDSQGNTISVNAGFLQVCKPQTTNGKKFTCPLGTKQLQGTGFDLDDFNDPVNNSAATGWLQTTAAVKPGSVIKLRFAIWDSGDGMLDSTVLIDNFVFNAEGAQTITQPVGIPK